MNYKLSTDWILQSSVFWNRSWTRPCLAYVYHGLLKGMTSPGWSSCLGFWFWVSCAVLILRSICYTLYNCWPSAVNTTSETHGHGNIIVVTIHLFLLLLLVVVVAAVYLFKTVSMIFYSVLGESQAVGFWHRCDSFDCSQIKQSREAERNLAWSWVLTPPSSLESWSTKWPASIGMWYKHGSNGQWSECEDFKAFLITSRVRETGRSVPRMVPIVEEVWRAWDYWNCGLPNHSTKTGWFLIHVW